MIGVTVGRYRLTRQIGAGGMGAVFAAQHETLGQEVAVKILHPRCAAQPLLVQRFFNEARAATRLRHPSVIQVFDFGTIETGEVFMIMELLVGEPLRSRLTQALPAASAFRIARQVAAVLVALHQQGIVHRDLKPDNLFMTADPEVPGGERVRLLDFGIARLRGDDEAGEGRTITATGVMLGTPLYMAPEQCRGAGPVDDRADIYALGVLLYQMLAGQPPFTASTPGDLMAKHLLAEPPPLPASVRADGAAALLKRMLAKAPDERPSAAALLAELERLGAPPSYLGSAVPPAPAAAVAAPPTLPEGIAGNAGGQRLLPPRGLRLGALTAMVALLFTGVLGLWLAAARSRQAVASQGRVLLPQDQGAAPGLPARTQAAPASSPVPASVHCAVTSQPEGARVLLLPERRVLGLTPWSTVQVRGNPAFPLLLEQPGYREQAVTLDPATVCREEVQLVPLPAPPAPRRPPRRSPARNVLTEEVPADVLD